jgi:hypothetical protein
LTSKLIKKALFSIGMKASRKGHNLALALELVKNLGFSKTSKLIERLGFSEITSDLQIVVVK